MIYTVTFNPALDYTIFLRQFSVGQIHRSQKEELYYGGKGINVSIVLSRLGVPNTALGFIAGFTGTAIETGLKQQGVKTDFIHLSNGISRINVKVRAEDETDINTCGPDIDDQALNHLHKKLDQIEKNDYLVLAGSIQNTLPDNTYETILERVGHMGVRVVVDASKQLLLKTLKHKPFLIKPNHTELGELFDTTLESEDQIILHAHKLQKMGARNVLVSMGKDGAILLTETGEQLKIAPPNGQARNTVGAGDSMVAGFLAGFLKTNDYSYSLKLGTAAGSATAFSTGLASSNLIYCVFEQML